MSRRPAAIIMKRMLSSVAVRGPGVLGHPPLSEPYVPGMYRQSESILGKDLNTKTQITTLPNGLKVATSERHGSMCSIGAVVSTGCRHEAAYQSGVSHFLEKLAFQSTGKYKSSDDIVEALQPYGGMAESLHFRDVAVYTISCFKNGVPMATEILSETLFKAQFLNDEVEGARESIDYEVQTLGMVADQEPIVADVVHAAGYNNNTVGLPKICSSGDVAKIQRQDLLDYYKSHFIPSRMVLVGVGIDHSLLVQEAMRCFPDLSDQAKPDISLAQYTGGSKYVHDTSAPPVIGPQELPTLTNLAIGFESCGHQGDDYVKYAVFNTLMGGGGSFSAGGPGKGMYSRLYLQVLNRYHWMYSAIAMNHVYDDTGMFTIMGSAHPSHGWDLAQVLIKQFREMTSYVERSEIERAKTQLKSTLLMNLEHRTIELEDIGRQVLASSDRKTAEELCEMIESVTYIELQELATKMLTSKPSVGAFGDLDNVPPYENICEAFNSKSGELEGRTQHFLLSNMSKARGLLNSKKS